MGCSYIWEHGFTNSNCWSATIYVKGFSTVSHSFWGTPIFAISCAGTCFASSECCCCNSMCCFSCSCAFKLQLVPVLALGLVRAPGYEQHLLLLLLLSLLRAADAISYGCACSANSGCCFCNSMCCLCWFLRV